MKCLNVTDCVHYRCGGWSSLVSHHYQVSCVSKYIKFKQGWSLFQSIFFCHAYYFCKWHKFHCHQIVIHDHIFGCILFVHDIFLRERWKCFFVNLVAFFLYNSTHNQTVTYSIISCTIIGKHINTLIHTRGLILIQLLSLIQIKVMEQPFQQH